VLVSGGGARNGFLWKLLEQQFPGQLVERLDTLGVPAIARTAAAAAVLAGQTLDGVAANLPLVTGAAGGRLVGRIIPGDQRNWSACVAWMAEQVNGYATYPRAA
jgi:anhydro-N-acetylmuramic acid kinase